MTATQIIQGTASQQARAATLFEQRGSWQYRIEDGRQVIVMAGRCGVYTVGLSGDRCSCPGSAWYPVCSHRLAAQRAAEHRAELERQHRENLRRWVEDQQRATQIAANVASTKAYCAAAVQGASAEDCRAAGHTARETMERLFTGSGFEMGDR